MTKKVGERWVHYIGNQSLSRWIPWIVGFLAVLHVGFAALALGASSDLGDLSWEVIRRDGLSASATMGGFFFLMAVFLFLVALLYIERRQFYLIIKKQERQIADLEARLSNRTEQP
jgi:hypothetical protein